MENLNNDMRSIITEIAGVDFSLEYDDQLLTLSNRTPAYDSFTKTPENRSGDIRINIRINTGVIPEMHFQTPLFEGGDAWAIYSSENGYNLTLNPPAFDDPVLLARINHDYTNVSIFCSEILFQIKEDKKILTNPVSYPLDQILLMHLLGMNSGMLTHAFGVSVNDKGFLFPGVSGAGKSTLSRQFTKCSMYEKLSDDRIAVRNIEDDFYIYGTPWPGEAEIALNKRVPLKGVFFLNHGTSNTVKEITPAQALKRILPVASIPWYKIDIMTNLLYLCENLVSRIPAYELCFKPDIEIISVMERYFI
jgi:hypothetical protein